LIVHDVKYDFGLTLPELNRAEVECGCQVLVHGMIWETTTCALQAPTQYILAKTSGKD